MKLTLQSLRILAVLTLITGAIYPAVATFMAQAMFPRQANGSLVTEDGNVIGSSLLSQDFRTARYFWPRPSAADYATIPSGASNLGPTSAKLNEKIAERSAKIRSAHHLPADVSIPIDLVHASGSGLDPDISPEAARMQISRVAQARGLDEKRVAELVERAIKPLQAGIFGKPRVNVLALNLMLDTLK